MCISTISVFYEIVLTITNLIFKVSLSSHVHVQKDT